VSDRAKVDYSLTEWGQGLCPVLDALLKRVELRESLAEREPAAVSAITARRV